MNVAVSHVSVQLRRRQSVRLVDAAGTTITCACGCLWITQHRDHRDIVVRPNESFILDRPGLCIFQALTDSTVEIEEPTPEPGRNLSVLIPGLLDLKRYLAWHDLPSHSAHIAEGGTMASRA